MLHLKYLHIKPAHFLWSRQLLTLSSKMSQFWHICPNISSNYTYRWQISTNVVNKNILLGHSHDITLNLLKYLVISSATRTFVKKTSFLTYLFKHAHICHYCWYKHTERWSTWYTLKLLSSEFSCDLVSYKYFLPKCNIFDIFVQTS